MHQIKYHILKGFYGRSGKYNHYFCVFPKLSYTYIICLFHKLKIVSICTKKMNSWLLENGYFRQIIFVWHTIWFCVGRCYWTATSIIRPNVIKQWIKLIWNGNISTYYKKKKIWNKNFLFECRFTRFLH